ncbi:MAG TPA: SPFH domain-containing protein [Nitrolancea sp.]|nr:SPFH domain-containing protein [Nitrolancea sp.]
MSTELNTVAAGGYQLAQVRIPLDDADDAFATRDASGRIPIVIVPTRPNRIRNDLVVSGLVLWVASIVASFSVLPGWTSIPGSGLALALIVLGVFRSFIVRIPEGTSGLLSRGGRYSRTVGSGGHIIPPWIAVSHVVTRREIPFDVPVVATPTKDTVRINIDVLLTFTIEDPYRFVYAISADDFDHVFQAACQEAMRTFIRRITVAEVFDLAAQDTSELRAMFDPDIEPYGVKIKMVKITFAQPPNDFMRSQEERQLAVLQRSEQTEKQALAERRQTDADTLARQRLLARIQRDQDELQIAIQRAENDRQLVELNAEIEALRLARLEERLRAYPEAVRADVATARLDVARALAANSRAVLQLGNADDISQVLMVRDLWSEALANANGQQAANPVDVATDETDTVTSESPSATAEIE